jgi:hypothetical protein
MTLMIRLAAFLLCLSIAACATPEHRLPEPDAAFVAEERQRVLGLAMETALARRARVYDLAWPVLAANAALCPETRISAGLVLADRRGFAAMAGGMREADLAELGVAEGLRIVHVMAGSPAALAGLEAGDIVEAIGDRTVETPEEAAKAIRAALEEEGATVRIRLADGREVETGGAETCDMAVKISTSQSLNAHAATGDIVVYTGAIRTLGDAPLQFLIAHEAAHLALNHPRKYWRNAAVSGAVVVGPVVYTGAHLLDRARGLLGDPETDLTSPAMRALAPWTEAFEREADYVGAYFFARAGGDLEAAQATFEAFSRENARAITVRSTHPLTPERLAALALIRAEIDAKRASGAPLEPERAE